MGIINPSILFGVPLVLLSSLLQLIPATSSWLPYLPHLYSLVLLVLSLMAVHHLSWGLRTNSTCSHSNRPPSSDLERSKRRR